MSEQMADLTEMLSWATTDCFYELFTIFETVNKIPVYQRERFLSCLPSTKTQIMKDIFKLGGVGYLLHIASTRDPGVVLSSLEEVREHYRELLGLSKEKLRNKI